MNLNALGDIVLIVLLVGWLGYRQTTWSAVTPSGLWRAPLILAGIGLYILLRGPVALDGIDLAVLVLQLIMSLGVGAWMGALAHFRPLGQVDAGRRDRGATVESRIGWWGLALWVLLIVVRIGMDVGATALGAHAVSGAGVILLVIAANRGACNAVLAARLGLLGSDSARPSGLATR